MKIYITFHEMLRMYLGGYKYLILYPLGCHIKECKKLLFFIQMLLYLADLYFYTLSI